MKRYIKNFMMAMMIGATVFGSSCTDSFEEVNTDPDSPTDVPTTNLLAYSLYYTSYRLYDRWRIRVGLKTYTRVKSSACSRSLGVITTGTCRLRINMSDI